MKTRYLLFFTVGVCWLHTPYVLSQETDGETRSVARSMEQTDAMLDRFVQRSERRTQKALRRFERYEKKMNPVTGDERVTSDMGHVTTDTVSHVTRHMSHLTNTPSLGKEPLLDSLRLAEGFRQYIATTPLTSHSSSLTDNSIDRAQQQLDISQRTKAELQQRKEYWKAQLKEHPGYGKWVGKMEKERYYYTAQVNEYRKMLRDPAALDSKLMDALRRDPRWSDFMAALPAKQQDPARMQPKELVQQMMQSQAASIDPDAMKLIQDAKKKGTELLGELSQSAMTIGNLDNATQMPEFTPNPYKTKNFWERIDIGFDLQFDRSTRFLPASGTAGVQAAFNFTQRWSAGLTGSYRFGMGEIKHIRFSHLGMGYGAFANYKIWKGLGVQAGYERNRRTDIETAEGQRFPAAWTSSALAGVTWEYGIGKKAKGTIGIFFDALYKQHTPETNAVLWRMGWKL